MGGSLLSDGYLHSNTWVALLNKQWTGKHSYHSDKSTRAVHMCIQFYARDSKTRQTGIHTYLRQAAG